jgi:enterochelin esterase-like enzyme
MKHTSPLRRIWVTFWAGTLLLMSAASLAAPAPGSVTFAFPGIKGGDVLDGRLLLLLSTDPDKEPRQQIALDASTQMVFGVDIDGLKRTASGVEVKLSSADFYGYPVRNLDAVTPGEYYVQAVLHRYETFHRSDGHVVKLPMDRGEGQHWNEAPGNLLSKPVKMNIGAGANARVSLDSVIPPIETEKDTKYVRHLTIQSKLLTKFWGRPMYLSAIVLVPEGFDEHVKARYPLAIMHDHFEADFADFRVTAPDPDLKPEYSKRFHLAGYNRIQQEEAYKTYQRWTSAEFPRMLVVRISHANPYYDDSYAVNSANVGPYGDAIRTELLPAVEKKYRALGQPWARFMYGGSTGGWESMAVQIFYPDDYNGAFAACPDPIDFRAMTNINLYADTNAFYIEGPHARILQPAMRDYLGHTLATTQSINQYELALGSHGRSGEQFDIWNAVYGPVGPDGYPRPVFDKETGVIDRDVAHYWHDHFDLSAIVQRDWSQLGPKLNGKLHVPVGSADTYFLTDAVYEFEDMLKSVNSPTADIDITYGDRAEHCWNGDPTLPNALSRLHYLTQYVPAIMARIKKTAPSGSDLTSWRY